MAIYALPSTLIPCILGPLPQHGYGLNINNNLSLGLGPWLSGSAVTCASNQNSFAKQGVDTPPNQLIRWSINGRHRFSEKWMCHVTCSWKRKYEEAVFGMHLGLGLWVGTGNWELGREEYVNLYSKFKVQTHQAPGTRPPPITRYASAPYNNKSIKSWDRDLRGYASFRIIYERRMWWPTETIFWFDVWLSFPPSRNGEGEILEAYPIPSIEAFAILR